MEAPTKGLFVGRDMCAERKPAELRMWIRSPRRHRCQWRHRDASQTRACQMNRGTMAESGPSQVNLPTTPSKISRTERALRTTMLLSTSVVSIAVLERRPGAPTRSASRVVSRVSLRTEIGEKVKKLTLGGVSLDCPREASRQSSVTDTGTYRSTRNSTT